MEAIDSLSSGATVSESELLSWLLSGEQFREAGGWSLRGFGVRPGDPERPAGTADRGSGCHQHFPHSQNLPRGETPRAAQGGGGMANF